MTDTIERVFRAYDVRGIYGKDLTEEVAEVIGKAFGTYLEEGETIIVGRDVRLSGEPLQKALMEGIRSTGCNVIDVGVLPTPIFYFSIIHYEADGGVMVTASHNPAEWNGFKFCLEKGVMLAEGLGLEKVKEIALTKRFRSGGKGRVERREDAVKVYSDFILGKINVERRLKVAIDAGNGACSGVASRLFKKAGVDVIALNDEPDGRFPAHKPEPTEETLRDLVKVVVEEEADFGIGYDGDGDRAVFIDDQGRTIPGDIALIIMARHYLKDKPGTVVYDVSCSMAVEEAIREMGGRPLVSRVGRAYLTNTIRRENAVLGGELSGHLYFADVYGFDDALYGGLKMAELLSKEDRRLSQIVDSIPKYPATPNIIYECPDDLKFKVVAQLAEEFAEMGYKTITIDGVKVINNEGWFLIRASNTLPQIKMRAEAKNEEKLRELVELAERKIKEEIG
ncbi:phosphoglucosamine mutase [Candidatus Bathyarchaeota archaeon]|nr:MAG: phosphoglucosamine mutase [Candidatus Bathyarchaeota archaeon]RJS79856.1 MAG: phosphoglucosamine mutase [Candidatus Bathyarchaeota archaeon]